jgi:hypothetical protein
MSEETGHSEDTQGDLTGYIGLCAAVIRQAVVDARAGDQAAAEWLLGPGARPFLDALDLEPRAVEPMVAKWAANPRGRLVIRLEMA